MLLLKLFLGFYISILKKAMVGLPLVPSLIVPIFVFGWTINKTDWLPPLVALASSLICGIVIYLYFMRWFSKTKFYLSFQELPGLPD